MIQDKEEKIRFKDLSLSLKLAVIYVYMLALGDIIALLVFLFLYYGSI